MPGPPSALRPVPLADLHPTQITVGFREVAQKRLRWRARLRAAGPGSLPTAPVVLGPEGTLYLIDRHHLLRAVMDEGLTEALVTLVADFSGVAPQDVWPALAARGWGHPYDTSGRRRPFSEIPSALNALRDDPYRSLASALRRAGGFSKKAAPYSEFAWADFLRWRISPAAVALDFHRALDEARRLAGTAAARDLPGWRPDLDPIAGARAASPWPHAVG